jgi:hypothetical protein
LNLDEKKKETRRTDNLSDLIIEETDAFGMENIFEQMRKYKGKGNLFSHYKQFTCLEEADQLTGDERKQFAEKVILSLWKNIGDDEDESDDE